MVMVRSVCPLASSLILLSSAARSWLPGGYCRTGSLAGTGTLVTASMVLMLDHLLSFLTWAYSPGGGPDSLTSFQLSAFVAMFGRLGEDQAYLPDGSASQFYLGRPIRRACHCVPMD